MTYPPHDQQLPPAPAPVATRRTNGLAVASLVVSVAGLVVCCGSVSGIVGAILGHVARGRIRRTGEAGAGMALAGILVGWTGLVIFLLAFTAHLLFNVMAVKIPGL
ncbi:DUF4190 domain-containing protein [Luedemannella helvata]|uniref:DUF4190 domain-containing protein n=1 Tax=Luedemannella helvata TaxID=349315 RepID=A0ABN2L5B4_9ACTN